MELLILLHVTTKTSNRCEEATQIRQLGTAPKKEADIER